MDVRGLQALLVLVVVVGCLVVPIPAASAAAVDGGAETDQLALQEDEEPETDDGAETEDDGDGLKLENATEIHIDVYLHENGSATFVVDYRFHVNDENESAERWQELRDDIDENPDEYVESERGAWNEVRADGENTTGREMNLSDFSVRTDESTAPRDLGHVEYTFEWSSFSHVELNRLEAGDALSGFTLVDDTTLQIFWPESYSAYEIDPESEDRGEGSVFWDGEGTEFTDDQPRIVLIENSEAADEPVETEEGPAMPWLAVAGALALLASLALVGWWLRHRREPVAGVENPREVPADVGETQGGPPPELLSNEERVLRLLEEHGSRVKQQEVVSELDWTEAKTSQVVSGLREEDEIEVFRIGRENVLALPTGDEEGTEE
ncbi:helix-turn-helix transcriptional regulator [Natronococcus wangiae]|uniref:helix-turn-helix transcriptional regulator n=1 Tax=Natronococcus wangiae TaxID=3068275 RepID=UPI00273D3E22|nr:hypothetical protein [Natronococcus sp. AD5]